MRGPFALWPLVVEMNVPGHMPGVYCLGKSREAVDAVGRADRDVKAEIKARFGDRYKFFRYETSVSRASAWKLQCEVFHRYLELGSLDDRAHPQRPDGVDDKCPVCHS